MTQNHCCEDRCDVRTKKVGSHTSYITDVVSDVICDSRRVANVVFGNSGFDLTDEIGTDVSGFGIDTATDTCKQCDRFSTKRETC